jgi:hypothetical protein
MYNSLPSYPSLTGTHGCFDQQAAYLLAWLMLLRIEEVVSLEFKSIDIIPGEREFIPPFCDQAKVLISFARVIPGAYFDVSLVTRKSAQTGVTHSWRVHANDLDVKLCPLRTLIRLAMVYGDNIKLAGPLFLRVNAYGAVTQNLPVVRSA